MDLSEIERPVVFFHDGCVTHDGWMSAFLAALRWPDAELHAVQYGDVPPWPVDVRGRDVLVVDFSFPRGHTINLRDQARSLLVLDHHAKAKDALVGLDFCVFDMDRSGAGLALDYFWPGARTCRREGLCTPHGDVTEDHGFEGWPSGRCLNVREIALAELVEDYDLWAFKNPDTRAVGIFLETVEKTVSAWSALPPMHAMAERGRTLMAYRAGLVDSLVRNAYPVRWPEGEILAVNSALFRNEIADAIRALPDPPRAALIWYRHEDGGFVCSLRSEKGGLDVDAVARRFGGGGHAQSAGFRCRTVGEIEEGIPAVVAPVSPVAPVGATT